MSKDFIHPFETISSSVIEPLSNLRHSQVIYLLLIFYYRSSFLPKNRNIRLNINVLEIVGAKM